MFQHRVARNRVLYFIIWLVLLSAFAYLVTNYQLEFYQLLFLAVIFLLPGRLVKYFWRDFFRGKKQLIRGKYDRSIELFNSFLQKIQTVPLLKWLMFFSSGLYSFKVEAVALTYLAIAYLHKKELDSTENHLKRALTIDTKYTLAFKYYAVLALFRGDEIQSRHYLNEALRHGLPKTSFDEFRQSIQKEFNF
ncbi:hypothetical protein K1X84_00450 [bacterium]|nr:hypothetical protein [bacterium]